MSSLWTPPRRAGRSAAPRSCGSNGRTFPSLPAAKTRPRRFFTRSALVHGAEMAENRGRTSGCVARRGRDRRAGIARRPFEGGRARATKPADEADRIDNIVVKIRGIEEQYARSSCRSRRISPPCSSACLSLRGTDTTWSAARQPRQGAPRAGNQASGRSGPHRQHQPSKGRRTIPARQSRPASCYTTASSAAALGHLGAVHKRGSGAKTARSRAVPQMERHRWSIRGIRT